MTLSSDPSTHRHNLPLLHAAQAQKEIFHNTALAMLDTIVAPVVQDRASDPAMLTPVPGQCWIVGASATGPWQGRDNTIACWNENGWIFMEPKTGMLVSDVQSGCFRIFQGGGWFVPNILSTLTGGNTVDTEARATLNAIIELLRNFRFLPSGET